MRRILALACALFTAVTFAATPPPPKDAKYVRADGSILIAGNDLMVPYMERLIALFRKTHPEFRFHLELQTSGLSVSGINAGRSALGPVARDVSFQEVAAFESRHGYPPTDIQVGWDNTPDAEHQPPGKYPPGVWVNATPTCPSSSACRSSPRCAMSSAAIPGRSASSTCR